MVSLGFQPIDTPPPDTSKSGNKTSLWHLSNEATISSKTFIPFFPRRLMKLFFKLRIHDVKKEIIRKTLPVDEPEVTSRNGIEEDTDWWCWLRSF